MDNTLVFDVGANNGDDTAYYLHRGHRVVSIEADPAMVATCRQRFASEIAQGRVTLLNVAIAPQDGTATFYVSQGNRSVWSSLEYGEAARDGLPVSETVVPARRLKSLIEQYGVPFYLKIDIEGAGKYCLADVTPDTAPRFLSFEADEGRLEDLFTVARCGYSRFKLIDQLMGFRQVMPPPLHTWDLVSEVGQRLARRALRAVPGVSWMTDAVRTRRPTDATPAASGSWVHPLSSSGPMADETDGPWRTLEQVAYAWLYFVRKTTATSWYDVHCVRD